MQPDTENLRRAADRLERLDSLWRESLLKINEVRTELGRAGFPVDEGAWPTEQLRALVNAYLSDGGSCGPIVSAAHDILNKSGIAHGGLVDRVTELRRRRDLLDIENNNLRDAHTKLFTQRADLSRRLDASERDRVGLLATLETVRGERNVHSLTAQRCHAALTEARVRDGALNDRVKALIAERDDARAKVRALDEERAGLARRLEQAEDERDALQTGYDQLDKTYRKASKMLDDANYYYNGSVVEGIAKLVADLASVTAERDALRPKPAGPVVGAPCPWTWDTYTLRANGKLYGSIGMDPATGMWTARVCLGDARVVSDERTARALLVAVAGYDPGVTFILTLRPDWTREGIDEAIRHDLGSYVAGMLEGYAEDYDDPQHDDDPDVARRWWAGGYKALNLASKDLDDDCPF